MSWKSTYQTRIYEKCGSMEQLSEAVKSTDTNSLILEAQSGSKEAADRLIQENLGLVRMAAKRFTGRGTEYEDIVQIGSMGLIKAIQRFDVTMDVRFSTYAVPLIIGELRRYFRDNGAVKVSRGLKETGFKCHQCREQFEKEHGREPTVAEVAMLTGCSAEEVAAAADAMRPVLSLDETAEDAEGSSIYNIVGEDKTENLIESIAVKEALSQLSPRERQIIMLRFFSCKTQTETARRLGVSQVQVSRLERSILEKIRELME
ncbi:MAG: SigB/SigF/SigG family RNA polymerase sigma factor [Bacillota bacterium]|nr:SigB/SigF/SigG family RNA polymerase sigma factor [Bacillota bacterium]